MLSPQIIIERFKRIDEDTWDSNPIQINEFIEFDCSYGLEVNKDSFTLKFPVDRERGTGSFIKRIGLKESSDNFLGDGDLIRAYAHYAGSKPADIDDALLFFGAVNNMQYANDEGTSEVLVKGVNRTGELLDSFVPATTYETGSNNNPPRLIKNIIERANRFAKPPIYAYLTNEENPYTLASGYIQATKSDGTEFGSISYHETWRSAYEQINKLSERNYTGDDDAGKYIFFVRNSAVDPSYYDEVGSTINELVWKSKPTTITGSLIEGEDLTKIKVEKSVFDVVNGLIVNAGTDFKGHGILRVAYNINSMAEVGPKFSYYLAKHNFSYLKINEFNFGSSVGSTFDSVGYPDDIVGGSEWSFRFQERDDNGSKIGDIASAVDTETYNSQLREEAGWIATEEAQEVVDTLGLARFKFNSELPLGSNDLVLGDVYEVQSKSFGWEGTAENPTYKLRLTDIKHSLSPNGWITTVAFREDEEVISGKLNT
jgi:hypothetical protein